MEEIQYIHLLQKSADSGNFYIIDNRGSLGGGECLYALQEKTYDLGDFYFKDSQGKDNQPFFARFDASFRTKDAGERFNYAKNGRKAEYVFSGTIFKEWLTYKGIVEPPAPPAGPDLKITCSAHCNDELGPTYQIIVKKDGTKVSGIDYGQNNNDDELNVGFDKGHNFTLDCTQTQYTDKESPLPIFYRWLIDINNASGSDAHLDLKGINGILGTSALWQFDYNGQSWNQDSGSHIVCGVRQERSFLEKAGGILISHSRLRQNRG
jgi:hypothetical protein